MKRFLFLLPLLLLSCRSGDSGKENVAPCAHPLSQLKIGYEFNSIILDGFCDSLEMNRIMDSLLVLKHRTWSNGFRTDSAFHLYYRKGKLSEEEDAYLWKNYLGTFYLNPGSDY